MRPLAVMSAVLVTLITAATAQAGKAGKLDPSFGDRGRVALPQLRGYATSTDIGRRGLIAVSGARGDEFIVARLRPRGDLDRSFAGDGIANIPAGAEQAATTAVDVGPSGAVVVAGMACTDDRVACHIVVSRLSRSGRLNRRFGQDGFVRIGFGNQFETSPSVARTKHGGIVLEATDCPSGGRGRCNVGLARIGQHGSLNRNFGDRGTVTIPFWRELSACGPRLPSTGDFIPAGTMALDSSERIVVAFTCAGRNSPTLARLKPNGHLDRSFGHGGKVYKDVGTRAPEALAIDSRDRIDVGGAGDEGFVVARFQRNGKRDSSFGRRGRATAKFPGSSGPGVPYALALDSKGRIVAGGVLGTGRFETAGAFARFKRNGRVNRRFGHRGKAIVHRGLRAVLSIAIDPRDRIVGAGNVLVRLLG
jgi:uncharacterized delta-60 repeat protein